MTSDSFLLYPALDIKAGVLARTPLSSLNTWSDALGAYEIPGIQWLHLVDLDFAFQQGSNQSVIEEVISKTSLKVQISGGIMNLNTLEYAKSLNPTRINLAPDFLGRKDDLSRLFSNDDYEFSFAIDVDEDVVVSRATGNVFGNARDEVRWLSENGCRCIILTDSKRDGRLQGVNLDVYKRYLDVTAVPIIASGGISSIDDVLNLAAVGVAGAVVGAALHEGVFQLSDALYALGSA